MQLLKLLNCAECQLGLPSPAPQPTHPSQVWPSRLSRYYTAAMSKLPAPPCHWTTPLLQAQGTGVECTWQLLRGPQDKQRGLRLLRAIAAPSMVAVPVPLTSHAGPWPQVEEHWGSSCSSLVCSCLPVCWCLCAVSVGAKYRTSLLHCSLNCDLFFPWDCPATRLDPVPFLLQPYSFPLPYSKQISLGCPCLEAIWEGEGGKGGEPTR